MQIKNNGYFSIEQLTEQYLSGTQKSDNTRETKEGLTGVIRLLCTA